MKQERIDEINRQRKGQARGRGFDLADFVLLVLVVGLVVLGFVWLKHKDEQARIYAEQNSCEWQAVGGFDICK